MGPEQVVRSHLSQANRKYQSFLGEGGFAPKRFFIPSDKISTLIIVIIIHSLIMPTFPLYAGVLGPSGVQFWE